MLVEYQPTEHHDYISLLGNDVFFIVASGNGHPDGEREE